MNKANVGVIGALTYLVIFLGLVVGWFMNLFHCIGYIGGGNVDDTTAEMAIRIVGIFTFLPGGIAGYF